MVPDKSCFLQETAMKIAVLATATALAATMVAIGTAEALELRQNAAAMNL